MAVAGTIGGDIGEQLALRTAIAIEFRLIGECLGRHHAGPRRRGTAIAGDPKNSALFQPLSDTRGGIARIEPDSTDLKAEAVPLAVEPA